MKNTLYGGEKKVPNTVYSVVHWYTALRGRRSGRAPSREESLEFLRELELLGTLGVGVWDWDTRDINT